MHELGKAHLMRSREGLENSMNQLQIPRPMERGVMAVAGLLAAHDWLRASSWAIGREIDHLALAKLGDPVSFAIFRERRSDLTDNQRGRLLILLVHAGFPSCIVQRITGHARKTIATTAGKEGVRLPNWRWGRSRPKKVNFSAAKRGMV